MITGPWGLVWANDGKTLFYTRTDETKRTNRIFRHTRGADAFADVLVKSEDDVKYGISVSRTRSNEFIRITSSSSTTSETWYVDASNPAAKFKVIAPRRQGVRQV